MKKKYFINANIVDPHNSIEENGGLASEASYPYTSGKTGKAMGQL